MNQAPAQGALSLLLVDDEASLRRALALNLGHLGYQIKEAATAAEGLGALGAQQFDVVLCDLRLPDLDGLSFLKQCRTLNPDVRVVLMTAFGGQDIALDAIKAGAYDCLTKPFAVEDLNFLLRKMSAREDLSGGSAANAGKQRLNFSSIIAQSDKMKEVFETVRRLSQFATTVLITGESGTGKELLARALHNHSPRRDKPFVAINCGAIPEALMESELFGHKKGSFTDATRDKKGLLEEADGGTVFLDEIGEMPLHLQVKLLRALQERQIRRVGDEALIPVDLRVVAATLRDLEEDVEKGRFRDDLYYRLNVVSIHLPALRERREDIPLLVDFFMKKHNKRLGLSVTKIAPDVMERLNEYHWRGNVRELENCIERALVLAEGDEVTLDTLPDAVLRAKDSAQAEQEAADDDTELSIKKRTRALEIRLIKRALVKTKGNRTHAAKILEISHRALLYKLKEYRLGEGDRAESDAEA